MNQNLRIAFSLILMGVCHYIFSQNYTVLGNATQLSGCECFRITPNAKNQAGAIFQNKTINLNNSFDFTFSVFFGCNNGGGADGLMFALTTNPNGLGNPGEGLGYAGNNQPFSFAVEFDTYQNGNVNDPSYHHIAFNSGGQYNHNVGGPVPALPNSGNIDDCQYHTVRVVWDVNSNTYSVYLDGNLRLSLVIPNIVQTYFGGNPIVNWGWTAATGGGTNEQNVCVQSISSWVAGVNYQSCSPTIQFQDVSTSNVGSIQSWAWTFGDGGTSTQQNPVHTYSGNGTYNVTLIITDISGCTKSYSHPVIIAPNITLTPNLQEPPCNGGNNGNITVNPSGGFGPAAGYGGYQYTWNTGQNTQTAVGLTAGTYTVTVTDGVCTTTGQYTLNQPTALTATISKTDPNCNLANGSATVTVSGGTPPYQYVNWPTISATNVASNLGPGTYIPDFKDANGCSSLLQYSVTLVNLPCGVNSSTTITNVTCFNGTNGSATLNVTGGGAVKTITWSNGTNGATISNVPAGTYTYNYSDNAGNTFSGSVNITQPAAPMVASVSTLNISCPGRNDGSVIASVTSGGTPNYTYTWSGGLPNAASVNNLPPGNYSVTITDGNLCTATATGTILSPTPLNVNITTTIDSCFQAGKGTATANVSGGNPPYLYQWSNIASAPTNLDLDAGNYTVTVTDNKGCTITGSANITQSPAINYTITPQNINCFGNTTGSINVNVSGGVPGYTYTWNPPTASGNNPQNLSAGKYIVTITDAYNCKKIDSVTLTQPASALSVTTSHTDVTCFGLNDGTITINVSGGTQPYSYLNNPIPAGSTTIPNLAPNTYSGVVSDNNGCTVAVSETVAEPAQLTVTEQHVNVSCFGGSNGSIDITANGGTTPYTFNWSDGNTNEDRNNLAQGTYSVTVSDFNNCTADVSVNILQPSDLLLTETHQNVACFGGNNGSIDVSVSGGTTNYAFIWNDGNTNEDRTNLSQGTYSLTVTDANNCTKNISVQITQPTQLVATTSHTDVTCFGLNNGTITINVSGGTQPYSYLNNPIPAGSTTIPNLAPNTYSGVVSDNNGCTVAVSETVAEPAQLTVTEQHVNVSCFGGSNGSIDITANGGTTPYTFNWSDGNTNEDRTNLAQGTYSVTVRDFNNCTADVSVNILQPSDLLLTETHQNVACFGGNNGSIDVSVSGGTTNYAFLWNDGNTNEDRTNLSQGTYSLTVTDANNCTKNISVQISQPTQLVATSSHTDVTCFGLNDGTITINVSGGTQPYSYLNNPIPAGSTTIPNLAPNTYSGVVSDNNGCTVAVSETVAEPAQLTVTEQHVNVSCFGGSNGSIDITANGGTTPYTFNWSDGNTNEDRTNLAQGTYSVTVRDFNNCTATISVNILQPSDLLLTETHQNVACFGGNNGSIDVSVSGGTTNYAFLWNDGNTNEDRTNLSQGTYSLTVTDANNCTKNISVQITQPTQLVATSSHTDVTCFGLNDGTITINVSGGTQPYSYLNNPIPAGSTTIPNLAPNTYAGVVSDNNGCTVAVSETVAEPAQLTVTEQHVDVSCFGNNDGSINITVSGGVTPYDFTWNDAINTKDRNQITAGNYSLTIQDFNNCTTTISVQIQEPAGVPLDVTTTDALCFGGNGTATASPSVGPGVHTFQWSAGNSTTSTTSLPAGSYTVTSTATNGCKQIGSFSINEPSAIVITTTKTDLSCNGNNSGSATVTANGGSGNYSYEWSGNVSNSSTANQLPAGNYSITVTDGNGCSQTTSIAISEPNAIEVNAFSSSTTCNGLSDGSIFSSATGGTPQFTYTASNNNNNYTSASGTFNNIAAGNYTIVATDQNNCTATTTVQVAEPTPVTYSLNTINVSCYQRRDGIIEITPSGGTPGYRFLRDGIEASTTGIYSGLGAGNYYIEVTDLNGCSATFTTTITEPDEITLTATPNPLSTPLGNPIEITTTTNQNGSVTYNWQPQKGLSCYNCENPVFDGIFSMDYTVLVTNANGCSASIPLSAVVVPDYTIYVPNFFTPNNDGSNDFFTVLGNQKAVKEFSLKVFNRWGEKVFESFSFNEGWDGYFNGKPAEAGVYVYHLKLVWIDNYSNNNFKGSVTLAR